MSENQEMLINTIQCRIAWYEKAIAMARGVISWENGFDWPSSINDCRASESVLEWRGSIRELKNTLNMLRAYIL